MAANRSITMSYNFPTDFSFFTIKDSTDVLVKWPSFSCPDVHRPVLEKPLDSISTLYFYSVFYQKGSDASNSLHSLARFNDFKDPYS